MNNFSEWKKKFRLNKLHNLRFENTYPGMIMRHKFESYSKSTVKSQQVILFL
jgi:hypothetical protein